MKMSPKSCSCRQCKRGKGSKVAKVLMQTMERSIRTAWRNQRLQEDPVVTPAPVGNYFD
jgi:hypothetical protein